MLTKLSWTSLNNQNKEEFVRSGQLLNCSASTSGHLVIQGLSQTFSYFNVQRLFGFFFSLLLILEKTDEVRNLRETRVLTEGEKKVWENIP